MKFQLTSYQTDATADVVNALDEGFGRFKKNQRLTAVSLSAPTGAGKRRHHEPIPQASNLGRGGEGHMPHVIQPGQFGLRDLLGPDGAEVLVQAIVQAVHTTEELIVFDISEVEGIATPFANHFFMLLQEALCEDECRRITFRTRNGIQQAVLKRGREATRLG